MPVSPLLSSGTFIRSGKVFDQMIMHALSISPQSNAFNSNHTIIPITLTQSFIFVKLL